MIECTEFIHAVEPQLFQKPMLQKDGETTVWQSTDPSFVGMTSKSVSIAQSFCSMGF